MLLFGFDICFRLSCRGSFCRALHKWPEANIVPNMTRDRLLSEVFTVNYPNLLHNWRFAIYCLSFSEFTPHILGTKNTIHEKLKLNLLLRSAREEKTTQSWLNCFQTNTENFCVEKDEICQLCKCWNHGNAHANDVKDSKNIQERNLKVNVKIF